MTIKELKYGDRFKLQPNSSLIYKIIRVHNTNVTVVCQTTGMVQVFDKEVECYDA